MKKTNTNQSGFTIIEVVLVLAIAGLIFLVVFLALPQLQRSRRDTARRDQVGRVIASLTQSASNNGGQFPVNQTELNAFITGENYFGACTSSASGNYECDSFSDPSEGEIDIDYVTATTTPSTIGNMVYASGATCNGNAVDVSATGTRQVAVALTLEQGGAYCQDNSD